MSLPTPTPEMTLQALRVFERQVLRNNLCQPSAATCLYLNPSLCRGDTAKELRARRLSVAKRYGWQTVVPVNFLNFETWKQDYELCTIHKSDTYVCYGGESNGSGRAVFIDSMQLKGVGRTVQAGVHSFFKDAHGSHPLVEAVEEMMVGRVLENVLSVPPIPVDFILVTRSQGAQRLFKTEADPRGSLGSILGRRGSPVRHAHIDYLLGALSSSPGEFAMATWRQFLNVSMGRTGMQLRSKDLLAWIQLVVTNALSLVADCRVFGLVLPNWRDNSDLFARSFDLADARAHFPCPLFDAKRAEDSARESPFSFFARWPDRLQEVDYHAALAPLIQALRSLEHIAVRIGLDERGLKRSIGWREINDGYERCLRQSVARLLAVRPNMLSARVRFSQQWPLFLTKAHKARRKFDWNVAHRAFFGSRERDGSLFRALGDAALRRTSRGKRIEIQTASEVFMNRLTTLVPEPGHRFGAVLRCVRENVEPAVIASRAMDLEAFEKTVEATVGESGAPPCASDARGPRRARN